MDNRLRRKPVAKDMRMLHETIAYIAGMMHLDRPRFKKWFRSVSDAINGYSGVPSHIVDLAEFVLRRAEEEGVEWGDTTDYDFFMDDFVSRYMDGVERERAFQEALGRAQLPG